MLTGVADQPLNQVCGFAHSPFHMAMLKENASKMTRPVGEQAMNVPKKPTLFLELSKIINCVGSPV